MPTKNFLDNQKPFDPQLCPPAVDTVFIGLINHPTIYIWDAWVWEEKGQLNLYTLASPRAFYESGDVDIQTQRDHLPHHWRQFFSTDGGLSWHDLGPVFAPRVGDADVHDSRSIWTGSVLPYQQELLATFTGIRQTTNDYPFIQSIGLAKFDKESKKFVRLSNEALTCPLRDYDLIRSKGYHLAALDQIGKDEPEEGGFCITAWRDASMVIDQQQQIHLLWSAKSSTRSPHEAVIGHGILHNPLTDPKLELLEPIYLPESQEFTQAEVPQILWVPELDHYILMVSTTNSSPQQAPEDFRSNVFLYLSKTIEGDWQKIDNLLTEQDHRYPGVLVSAAYRPESSELVVRFTAPNDRSAAKDLIHTMPAVETKTYAGSAFATFTQAA